MLQSEGSNVQKIVIFAVILALFGVVGYFATSSDGTTGTAPKIAAAAPPPSDPATPQAPSVEAGTTNAGASSSPSAGSESAASSAPASAASSATPVAANDPPAAQMQQAAAISEPSSAPVASASSSAKPGATLPSQADAATTDSETASATAEPPKRRVASKKGPARIAASAPPPALDALSRWWETSSTSPFKVAAVGPLSGGSGLVVVFNDDVKDVAAAAERLSLKDDRGATVAGNWEIGGSGRVLVRKALPVGRYRLSIDPMIASARGDTLGMPAQGPVFVQ